MDTCVTPLQGERWGGQRDAWGCGQILPPGGDAPFLTLCSSHTQVRTRCYLSDWGSLSSPGYPHQPLSSSAFPVCLPPPRSASRELRGARLQLSLMGPSSMGTEPCKASRIPQHVMFPQTCVRPGVPYTETMPVSLWDERGH